MNFIKAVGVVTLFATLLAGQQVSASQPSVSGVETGFLATEVGAVWPLAHQEADGTNEKSIGTVEYMPILKAGATSYGVRSGHPGERSHVIKKDGDSMANAQWQSAVLEKAVFEFSS